MKWWCIGGGTLAAFVLQFPLYALLGYNWVSVVIDVALGMLAMLLIAVVIDRWKGRNVG